MAENTKVLEDFSPILLQNYIRVEAVYNFVKNDEEGNENYSLEKKFSISKDNYKKIMDFELHAPLINLSLSYDENSETLTVVPSEELCNEYKNKIMRDVVIKQHENFIGRYSNYINAID